MDNSGSAFPQIVDGKNMDFGLTKREWLAGMALQGMCANPDVTAPTYNGSRYEVIANTAFQLADAMILASKEKGE